MIKSGLRIVYQLLNLCKVIHSHVNIFSTLELHLIETPSSGTTYTMKVLLSLHSL